MDCCFLLQGIFSTQGSNLSLGSPELAGGYFTTELPGKPIISSRERKVKEEKRLSTLFSNESRSLSDYVTLMAFVAVSLKRDSTVVCFL